MSAGYRRGWKRRGSQGVDWGVKEVGVEEAGRGLVAWVEGVGEQGGDDGQCVVYDIHVARWVELPLTV